MLNVRTLQPSALKWDRYKGAYVMLKVLDVRTLQPSALKWDRYKGAYVMLKVLDVRTPHQPEARKGAGHQKTSHYNVLDVRTPHQPPALKPSVGHQRTLRYTCRTSEHHINLYHGSVPDTRGRHITGAGRQNTTSACITEVCQTPEDVTLQVLDVRTPHPPASLKPCVGHRRTSHCMCC